MSFSATLKRLGRAIAYHPQLAKPLGGACTAILFDQLFFWQDKTSNPLGVYKTLDELKNETGLTDRELQSARKKLRELGIVIETNKRLEHRLYFKVDCDAFDRHMAQYFRDNPECNFGNTQNVTPPNDETSIRGDAKRHFVNTEITTEITTENTPIAPLGQSADADHSAGASPKKQNKSEKSQKSLGINYSAIAEVYNGCVERSEKDLPLVANPNNLSDKRKHAIKKLGSELKKRFGDCSPEVFHDYFTDFIQTARAFYFGENDRGWRANFEYLLRIDTLDKTLERTL